ncbi:hypothetical protein TNIN_147381 [Trichonephila inaurata madagascariensis]|uniref:Uncharacterized protein n=1 Tax=Trichonephila inaurata madagascariensis TaxID=2747483 RepID=A0A8X7CR16_9ARAC|nr:hypothetical protein TNIN_147381 [Trichonephila inaurata madagascariensis]
MDEPNVEIILILFDIWAWIIRVIDVMVAVSYEIPLHFCVMYFIILIFVVCRIPEEGMWRIEASVLANFVFCQMCAKGSSIFQIAVNAERESVFTKIGNVYMFILFVIRFYREFFPEDNL